LNADEYENEGQKFTQKSIEELRKYCLTIEFQHLKKVNIQKLLKNTLSFF